MKILGILTGLLLLTVPGPAQQKNNTALIDKYARSIGYLPLKTLATKLTAPYASEADKVRSLFIWITAHIGYDVKEYNNPDSLRYKAYEAASDLPRNTDLYWNRVLAAAALKDRIAVCAGYAALFKALCDEAGIRSVVIEGNGRTYLSIGQPWVSNHAWNAVNIDGQWKLLDLTWASGSVSGNVAVRRFNPYYYCVSPEDMILDHYPDSLKWSFLAAPPSRKIYEERPYVFLENGLKPTAYTPQKGVLAAKQGDSIRFSITVPAAVCSRLSVYDVQNNAWTEYGTPEEDVNTARPAKPVNTVRKRKVVEIGDKGPTKEDKAAIEAMIAYVNSAPDGGLTASVSGGHAPLRFSRKGDTLSFSYPVLFRGSHLIHIYWNENSLMAYVVNGR